jgi:hypothetical protein
MARGDTAAFFSVGAYISTFSVERVNIVKARGSAFDKAQRMVRAVTLKNRGDQLNATVVLVEGFNTGSLL